MRLGWAIVGGVLLGTGVAWWLSRDTPTEAQRQQRRAGAAHRADTQDARPVLYRWRDANGTLQVTAQPPTGADARRHYERVDRQPRDGIEVRGERE